MRKVCGDTCLSDPVNRSPRAKALGRSRRPCTDVLVKAIVLQRSPSLGTSGRGLIVPVDVKSTGDFPLGLKLDRRDTSCIANPVFKKFLYLLSSRFCCSIQMSDLGLVYFWMCT